MKKRTIAMFLSVALCLSVALTGCGADKSQQSNPSDDGKKSLTIAVLNDVVSLDPAVKDSAIEMQMASHLYDPLVDYDANMNKKPGLAESWTVLDDGVTWEFKLRQGVKFSNGNDFNADDVVFSFERILNDPTLEMGVYLMRLQEVKKVDDYTVQLVTKIPYPVFAGSLIHIMMLDKETCEGLTSEEISANPVGTGRYRLVEHVKESYIKLVRNDEYWGELPDAETVEFRVIANAATRTTALINGEVDFISNIPVMDVNRLENDPNVQVITNPSLSCNYMGFDQLNEHGSAGTDDPNPLLNVKVRQAIYHAIDIQTIVDTVMNGYATVANSYMPSICVGYNADAERPAYDPELAKQLLAEAGYPDGFYLRIDARNDSDVNADQVSQAIASYLEKVGIQAEVNLLPRASFYEKTSAENLQSSFFMAGWGDSSGEGILVFVLANFIGDPVNMLVSPKAPPEVREQVREELGLNRPILEQYVSFVTNAFKGDFGKSYIYKVDVLSLIAQRVPATLELVFVSVVLALVISIPLGVYAGAFPKRKSSTLVMGGSILGISLPSFFIGIMLIYIFSLKLHWFPSSGRGATAPFLGMNFSLFAPGGLKYIILPAFTLSVTNIASLVRLTRAGVMENMRQDYIKFARAKGVSTRKVLFGHALKNALIPVITVFGMEIGSLIAFTTVTETIFSWPGLGKLLIDSINSVDRPVIVAYLILTTVLFVFINFVVDLLYTVIDPRIQFR